MNQTGQKVAVITGASRGIGASLVAAYRRQGWAVVATARTMKPTEDPDVLTVEGDIADVATADRIVGGALGRFGRIDTLVNNAGVFISKPFTDYTADDYARIVGVNISATCGLRELRLAVGPGRADQGRPGRGHPVASARSATLSTASCSSRHRRTSPGRSCTSTAARSPVTD
jgi:NAD(P)-dependent dehydrogenase (short-subunit alcohol dehydrogenase family)